MESNTNTHKQLQSHLDSNTSLSNVKQQLAELEQVVATQQLALEVTKQSCADLVNVIKQNTDYMREQDTQIAMHDLSVQLLITASKQYMPIGEELEVEIECGRTYNVVHDSESGQIVFEAFHETMH